MCCSYNCNQTITKKMIIDNILKLLGYLLIPLILTIVVECGITLLLFRKGEYTYYILLLNLLTNPLLNFIMLVYFSYIGMKFYYAVLYALEVVVVVAEGLLFAKLSGFKRWKALLLSLGLNGCSYAVGLVVL